MPKTNPHTAGTTTSQPETRAVMGNADLCISRADLPKLKSQALSGDGSAAWKVSLHYGFCTLNLADGGYWAHIAGQDSPQYYRSYASELGTQSDVNDMLRSIFWYNKSSNTPSFKVLLPAAQEIVDDFNREFAHHWPKEMLADPAFNSGTISAVYAFNRVHLKDPNHRQFNVNSQNMWPLRVDALLGGVDAADGLANFYEPGPDYEDFFYWKTIAAEDGDASAELFVAETYAVSVESNDRIRANFLAEQAVAESHNSKTLIWAKGFEAKLKVLMNENGPANVIPSE